MLTGKYFRNEYDNLLKFQTSAMVSKEAIFMQTDTQFIEDIRKLYIELGFPSKDDTSGIKSGIVTSKIKSTNEKISSIIKERFGLNIFVLSNSTGDFYTFPINLKITNPLSQENLAKEDVAEEVDKYNRKNSNESIEKSVETTVKKGEISKFSDVLTMYTVHLKNYSNALKDAKLSNVVIDLKNAKVSNLPEVYKGFITLDYKEAYNFGLNADEMMAILFHEVGHNFTYVENTMRQTRNNTILLDTLKNEIGLKNKSKETAIKIAYEKIYGEKVPNGTSMTAVIINWVKNERAISNLNNINTYPNTDSEALADQFVSRLGLGGDIVSALQKMTCWYEAYMKQQAVINAIFITGLEIWIAIVNLVLGAILAPLFFLLLWAILDIGEKDTQMSTTYDTLYKRYQRMKLDAIRQLRTNPEIDNKYKDSLIATFDKVDQILSTMKKPSESVFGKLYRLINSNAKLSFDMKRTHMLIEEMLENDLYAAAYKLQQHV